MSSEPTNGSAAGSSVSSDVRTLMTAEEAADFLRVTRRTLYRYVRLQLIPHMRAARVLRFFREDLVQWLKANGSEGTVVDIPVPSPIPSPTPSVTQRTRDVAAELKAIRDRAFPRQVRHDARDYDAELAAIGPQPGWRRQQKDA